MKIIRYFLRGVESLVRDLTTIKKVVRPRHPHFPTTGRTKDVLRYIASQHALESISLFDEKGTLLASSREEMAAKELFNSLWPVADDLDARYVFIRKKDFWVVLFKRRGFYILVQAPYKPDVVDLWVLGRDVDRLVWGSTWEG